MRLEIIHAQHYYELLIIWSMYIMQLYVVVSIVFDIILLNECYFIAAAKIQTNYRGLCLEEVNIHEGYFGGL